MRSSAESWFPQQVPVEKPKKFEKIELIINTVLIPIFKLNKLTQQFNVLFKIIHNTLL